MPRSKQEAKKRKKRRAHILKDSPFPVPIATMMAEPMPSGAWFYYTGYVEGSTVIIKHTGDMDFLHKMGFFGKGTLSRSEPSFQERKQRVNIRLPKPKTGGQAGPPSLIRATVTSKRNYLAHRRYEALASGNGTEYNYIIHCEEQQKLGLEGLSDEEGENREDDDEDDDSEADSDDGGPRRATVSPRSGRSSMMEAYHLLNFGGRNAAAAAVEGSSGALGEGSSSSTSDARQMFSEMTKETRLAVVALLSEVASLSKENIATFAKVPLTMAQLRDKYEALQQTEMAIYHHRQQAAAAGTLLPRSGTAMGGGGFRQGEVIELDDDDGGGGGGGGGGDSVLVLDSDDEDSGDDVVERKKAEESEKGAKAKSKGWGDYDEEDLDGWGEASGGDKVESGKEEKSKEAVNEKGDMKPGEGSIQNKSDTDGVKETNLSNSTLDEKEAEKESEVNEKKIGESSNGSVLLNGATHAADNVRDGDKLKDEEGEEKKKISLSSDNLSQVQASVLSDEKKNAGKASLSEEKVEGVGDSRAQQTGIGLDKSETSNGKPREDGGVACPEVQDTAGAGSNVSHAKSDESKQGGVCEEGPAAANLSVDTLSNGVKKNGSGGMERESEGNDGAGDGDQVCSDDDEVSNDSDDVICIESESAAPSKVHNLLSQGGEPRSVVVTKTVTFMSNNTFQPTYVAAKVGFSSWNSLVHFNYTGDPLHLPTVMKTENKNASPSSSSSNSSPYKGEDHSRSDSPQQVYERVFPPVNSLFPLQRSQGALIKQRTKALPCLASAYIKLSSYGVSSPATSVTSNIYSSYPASSSSVSYSQGHRSQTQQRQTLMPKSHPATVCKSAPKGHSSPKKKRSQLPTGQGSLSAPTVSQSQQSLSSDSTALPSNTAHSPITLENSSDSFTTTSVAQKVSSPSHLHPKLISDYLGLFGGETDLDPGDSKSSGSQDAGSEPQPSLSLLLDNVKNLKQLFSVNSSEKDVETLGSQEAASLLSKFCVSLSQYLPVLGLTSEKESEVLAVLLSKANNVSSISDKALRDELKNLTPFQIWLLERRRNFIKSERNDTGSPPLGGCSPPGESNAKKRKINSDEDFESSESKRLKAGREDKSQPLQDISKSSDSKCDTEAKSNKNSSLEPVSNSTESGGGSKGNCVDKMESVGVKGKEVPGSSAGDSGETEKAAKHSSPGDSTSGKSCSDEKNLSGADGLSETVSKGKSVDVSMSETVESVESVDIEMSESPKKTKKSTNKSDDLNSSTVDRICIGSSSEEEEEEDYDSDESSNDSVEDSSSPPPTLDAREMCKTDDPSGELFVINNTSEEEELEDDGEGEEEAAAAAGVKDVHRWRPCVKRDPHRVEERLHLTLEEAFFLSYGLGCLKILDPESKVLDLTETWRQFQVLKEQFVPHYVAYHYFRSKGWVPKCGLKFGCDFILYREGPPFYHGSYSVVVQCVREGSLLPCTRREGYHLDHRHLNWISLAGLNRITEHVAKELMFCYVIWPKGLSKDEAMSPECISKFKIKEVLVSRWVSSQERENKPDEEEMP